MDFNYKVKNRSGEIVEGIIDAPSQEAAVNLLHDNGLTILGLESSDKGILSVDVDQYISKPNNKDIVIFTRQLSTLVDADMPLSEGLRTLSKQAEKSSFKKVILEISEKVEAGSPLSSAFAEYPKLFSVFYIKLVHAGEVSGKLHDSLLYLAEYLERSSSISSKLRGALMYPAFVVFALVTVSAIMAIYVLPQLLSIFEEAGVEELPITTRMLIFVTGFVNDYLYPLLVGFVLLCYLLYKYINSPAGRVWFDNFKISIPTIGKAIRNLYLARVAESLSTLIKAGIPILDTLRITSDLVGNENYKRILIESEEVVRGGGRMSEVFSKYKEMPPLFSSMIAIGEKTGKLDSMLEHISKFYKSESEDTINNMTQLIEPILVLVLGFAVAILVSSILLPIYGLVGA